MTWQMLSPMHCIFSNSLPPPTGALLDRVHPSSKMDATSDVMTNWQEIDTGVTPQANKDQKNTGGNGTDILPHGTLNLSYKTVNNSTSSFLPQFLVHGSIMDITERGFKSRFQLLLRRYQPSESPSTWVENPSLQNCEKRLHNSRQRNNRGDPLRRPSTYPTTCIPYQCTG